MKALPPIRRWTRPAAVASAVIVLLVFLHLETLLRFPAPFVDEAWFANRAWSVVTRGQTIGSLDVGVVSQFPGSWFFFPLLPVLLQAAVLAVVGEPSLAALRVLSLVLGAALALAIWKIARSMHDHASAVVSVVLLTLSAPFLYSSHLARYDVMAAALGWGGIALYVSRSPRRVFLAGLGGLCAGLAMEFHPFAVVIAVALPVLAIDEFGWNVHRQPVARALAVGLLVGAAVYPVIHVFPNPRSYFALSRILYGPTHIPVADATGAAILGSVRLTVWTFALASPLVAWAMFRLRVARSSGDRRIALMAVTVLAAFTVVVRNKLPYYAILFSPGLILCLAVWLRTAVGNWRAQRAPGVAWLTISLVMVGHAYAVSIRGLASHGGVVFEGIQQRLAAVIKPGDSIMGSQTYWFGLPGHCYYSWEQLIYLQRFAEGTSAIQALATFHPDVFVRDGHLDEYLLDQPGNTLYQRRLRLPRMEIEAWLAEHATVVADFDGEVYGRVRVYRLRWADSTPSEKPGAACGVLWPHDPSGRSVPAIATK